MAYKLGKLPPSPDHRDLLFESYANPRFAPPPVDTGDLRKVADWGMLGNGPDPSVAPGFGGAGDCVFAGADHESMLWMTEGGSAIDGLFTGKTAIADYSAVTGYDPADPSTDRGTMVRDALKYRRKTGIVDMRSGRHKLSAFVALEPGNTTQVKEAIHVFDAVGIGFRFPDSAMAQFDAGKPWRVVAGAQVEGGHYVPLIGYDERSVFCVTWSKVQPMTWGFFSKYTDEAWALLCREFLVNGASPDGFDWTALEQDLSALG
jgi:hypothetical protein